jgi:hypothetical protein
MTAHELARQLLAGPDLPVHHSYPTGDYWRTQGAPEVRKAERGLVKHSDYHQMDTLQDDKDDGEGRRVVVIS